MYHLTIKCTLIILWAPSAYNMQLHTLSLWYLHPMTTMTHQLSSDFVCFNWDLRVSMCNEGWHNEFGDEAIASSCRAINSIPWASDVDLSNHISSICTPAIDKSRWSLFVSCAINFFRELSQTPSTWFVYDAGKMVILSNAWIAIYHKIEMPKFDHKRHKFVSHASIAWTKTVADCQ